MIKVKLNSSELGVAWMLKYDGTAVPCKIHIYGALGDLNANLEAALWMKKYNDYDKLDQFIKEYVCYTAVNKVPYTPDDSAFRTDLMNVLSALPFNPGAPINMQKSDVAKMLYNAVSDMTVDEIYDLGENVDEHSGDFVCNDLNETFIRVRMNDEYNASSYNGVGYFRIGSTNKNWTNPIYMFVADHNAIKTIVVERDAESDDKMAATDERDVMINNMPREEFLAAERLPFLGARDEAGIYGAINKVLSAMDSKYSDIFSLRANSKRLNTAYFKTRAGNLNSSTDFKTIKAPWATKPMNR